MAILKQQVQDFELTAAVVQPVVQTKTILRHWSETVVDAADISGVKYVS